MVVGTIPRSAPSPYYLDILKYCIFPYLDKKSAPGPGPYGGRALGLFFPDDLEVGIYAGNNPYLFIHET